VTVPTINMPNFAGRLAKAFFCQGEPDRVPLVEAGIDKRIKERFLQRPIVTVADEIEFWATAGYDFIPLSAGLRIVIDWAIHHEASGRLEAATTESRLVTEAKAFASEKLSAHHLTTSNDDGTIRTWAPEGMGFINSLDDLHAFPWPAAEDFDLGLLTEVRSLLPPGMGQIPFAGAVFSSVMLMMGIEECLIGMLRETPLFCQLTERVGRLQVDIVRILLEHGLADAIWINDDMGHKTGLLASPRLFRKYIFPYYRQIKRLTNEHGTPLLLHSDGRITDVLPDLIEIGFNAIHPIDPSGMDIEETRRMVGPGICLIGNLPLTFPLGTGTPADVSAATEELVRKMAPGGGYCLSSGNSIPDYIPYENWLAMRDTALMAGVYPIG
jgi:uroporphyrinogen decarboxylase